MSKNNKYGILLAISSLPGNYGIGDFGSAAYAFVDYLKANKYKYWQILPLNPIGPGNSPYMSMCSNAIETNYIDLDELFLKGYLIKEPKSKKSNNKINYKAVKKFKNSQLVKAYKQYIKTKDLKELNEFKKKNKWVIDYAIFTYFRYINNQNIWNLWPKEHIEYNTKKGFPKGSEKFCNYICFTQMIAFSQYKRLKEYANKNGIKIIADCPFYVGIDSMDCWINRKQFKFDEKYNPTLVSGVPPDYFNADGQLWGTPIYDFEKMKLDGYKFLINRIFKLSSYCDLLRLDHFRAFDTYCVIPSEDTNAKRGEWKLGPGKDFFDTLYKKHPHIKLIAEDLGDLFQSVHDLRDYYNLPGMYVTQFMIFDENLHSNSNQIVYTGTHDNQTIVGFIKSLNLDQKKYLKNKFKTRNIVDGFLTYTKSIPSLITILPMQDILLLDDKARMNCPGVVDSPNWEWKLK